MVWAEHRVRGELRYEPLVLPLDDQCDVLRRAVALHLLGVGVDAVASEGLDHVVAEGVLPDASRGGYPWLAELFEVYGDVRGVAPCPEVYAFGGVDEAAWSRDVWEVGRDEVAHEAAGAEDQWVSVNLGCGGFQPFPFADSRAS